MNEFLLTLFLRHVRSVYVIDRTHIYLLGFSQCKYAVINESSEILDYGAFRFTFPKVFENVLNKFIHVINKHNVTVIALGNGKACRETEKVVMDVIQSGEINMDLDLKYTIVNEQGASIYRQGTPL